MKTLVIIVGVLALTTVVYSFDGERLRKFYENFAKCTEELGGKITEPSADALKCTLVKDGRIFNAEGAYIKEEALKAFEDGITDAGRLDQAQSLFTKCYDDAVQAGGTVDEQTMKIVECTIPIFPLLDKLT